MNIETTTLSNGIRLIHVRCKGDVAYCGVMVNVGTRDELESENGMAHLTEHILFKGTEKRNYIQIINRIEDVGGEMNAYTTKEETTIYALFLKRYLERAMELIADMIFNYKFDEHLLQKEKEVVADEIDSYTDNPSELILDDFEDELFAGHSLGRNTLGSKKILSKITVDALKSFIARCYTTDEMVFYSMGEFSFERVEKLAQKIFGIYPSTQRMFKRTAPINYEPKTLTKHKATSQVHLTFGNRAYNAFDDKRYSFFLLNNILGGGNMNSRLNMALREKHALVYSVESMYTPYSDVGNWNVYLGTDSQDVELAMDLVHKEIENLKSKKLSASQLQKLKAQWIAQMIIAGENRENWLMGVVKQFMNTGKIESKKEIESIVSAISENELQTVAEEVFDEDKFTYLYYR